MKKQIPFDPTSILSQSVSYAGYLSNVENIIQNAKTTDSDNVSSEYLHYYSLGLKRMKRLDKTIHLNQATVSCIKSIQTPQTWLVISEGWCGDAAHSLPIINKMAEINPNIIRLEIIYRDQSNLIEKYLTNGGKSIPKLIAFNRQGEELFVWGPRPREIQRSFLTMKNDGKPFEEISTHLQKMYNKSKGLTIQKEICNLTAL